MDSKRRSSSFDDPGLTASALRRLTHTPRLSLRRPGTPSSVDSHDHDDPVSCVTRDTSHDECALNRFLVWAAVKRNTCKKMTPEEKRECPLLRCRKRFPNHELMLRHLYACEELSVGEYWCYDCEKVERFADAKCKRCLGHPSKRSKIKSLARNFFSSVGHRSKTGSLLDLRLDVEEVSSSEHVSVVDGDEQEVPSPQGQVELQANEIHEIDSHELKLPTISEEEAETPSPVQCQLSRSLSPRHRLAGPPLTVQPAELESVSWQPSPHHSDTVSPVDLTIQPGLADNPKSQGQDQVSDFAKFRNQAKRRSKMLAPSTSVRSNKSADTLDTLDTIDTINSTNSYDSAVSGASYAASTVSSLSEAWAPDAYLSSALTPSVAIPIPINDFGLPTQSCEPTLDTLPAATGFEPYEDREELDFLDPSLVTPFATELPADVPMLDIGSADAPMVPSLDFSEDSFNFDLPPIPELHVVTEPALNQTSSITSGVTSYTSTHISNPTPGAQYLVSTAWDAAQMHIKESMDRLQHVDDNHLVVQLRTMTPEDVCSSGLRTLSCILNGKVVESPVDLLCFIHLVYSFSLVIHEQDAQTRASSLFTQAVSYGAWFTKRHRHAYLPIVDLLWKPTGMAKSEVVSLIRSTSIAARSKGKMLQTDTAPSKDSLILVAQFFLDELEHAALQEKTDTRIQASALCVQHMKDRVLDFRWNSHAAMTFDHIRKTLLVKFASYSKFTHGLEDLHTQLMSGHKSTPRRLELDLMYLGKMNLSADAFYDEFVPVTRAQTEPLYLFDPANSTSRSHYYELGIHLIESLMTGSHTSGDWLASDALLNHQQTTYIPSPTTPALDNFDLLADTLHCVTYGSGESSLADFTMESLLPISPATNIPDHGDSSNATNTPTSLGSGEAATDTSAKLEPSSSCCELCGYRPEGDPRWFPGSMAKHKKLQHGTSPPRIYQCPYPGCSSKYTNRPDNLRQHQLKKGHFVDGGEAGEQPRIKRKKMN